MNEADLMWRVADWVRTTFGSASLMDRCNRAARVFEEAAELLQAEGGDLVLAHAIVARTFSRPKGEVAQEAAGVQLTLLAHGYASTLSPIVECERELARVKSLPPDSFRRKQAEKFNLGTDLAPPII